MFFAQLKLYNGYATSYCYPQMFIKHPELTFRDAIGFQMTIMIMN